MNAEDWKQRKKPYFYNYLKGGGSQVGVNLPSKKR